VSKVQNRSKQRSTVGKVSAKDRRKNQSIKNVFIQDYVVGFLERHTGRHRLLRNLWGGGVSAKEGGNRQRKSQKNTPLLRVRRLKSGQARDRRKKTYSR